MSGINPFESPKVDVNDPSNPQTPSGDDPSRAEKIRREYLNHETSVRAVGLLYYLGAIILAFSIIALAVSREVAIDARLWIAGSILLCYACGAAITGYGLRRLTSWARIPVAILGAWGLISSAIGLTKPGNGPEASGRSAGTIFQIAIMIYILYLVWSDKGKYVCSDEYKAIIAQTPHIRYKVSMIVWVFVGLLVTVLFCGLLSIVLMKPPLR